MLAWKSGGHAALGVSTARRTASRLAGWLGSAAIALVLSGCATLPVPMAAEERDARIDADFTAMFAGQEPVTGPIDLYEAVARGLKYNLEKRLRQMELGLADARLRNAQLGMLPRLAANAGWRSRSNRRASWFRSVLTGRQSLEVSTSEDRELRTADLQMVWNVLDFGLTYLRARQEADRALIAEERRIKVAQNVVLDIRDAFWRAAAAQRMLPRVERVIVRIYRAVERSKGVLRSDIGEPAQELARQRALLAHLRELMAVRQRLALAKTQLAALMNLAPGTRFRLAVGPGRAMRAPRLRAHVVALERAALANRPELREEDYRKRISQTELRAAWVRLLPGIELRYGRTYDSNAFLLHHGWINAGALITKNLMEIATARKTIDQAERGVEVADARRLALSMAVIAQVHIALQRYALARDIYRVAAGLHLVDSRLSEIAEKGASSDAAAEAEALEALSRHIVSELKYYAAYADLQNAYGRILNSVGAHRFPADVERLSVKELAGALRRRLDDWRPPVPALRVAAR